MGGQTLEGWRAPQTAGPAAAPRPQVLGSQTGQPPLPLPLLLPPLLLLLLLLLLSPTAAWQGGCRPPRCRRAARAMHRLRRLPSAAA